MLRVQCDGPLVLPHGVVILQSDRTHPRRRVWGPRANEQDADFRSHLLLREKAWAHSAQPGRLNKMGLGLTPAML